MKLRILLALSISVFVLIAAPEARADCSSPSASESATDFDFTNHILRYCDGTDWVVLGGGIPNGTIAAFAATSCPSGWTEYTSARGRFLRGIDNGAGNDPDGTRAPSNVQDDELASHAHNVDPPSTTTSSSGSHTHTVTDAYVAPGDGDIDRNWSYTNGERVTTTRTTSSSGNHTHTVDIAAFDSSSTGGSETRPKNVAVLFCQYAGGAPLVATPSGAAGAIQFADGSGGLTSNANIVVSSGNVGIGTASPSAKLDVNGSIAGSSISGTLTHTNGYFVIEPYNGTYDDGDWMQSYWDGPNNRLRVYRRNSSTGNLTMDLYVTGTVTEASDRTLKKDIHVVDNALEQLTKLRGVSFVWKDRDKSDLGFIAQEVEPVFPEIVRTDENGLKSLNYNGLMAPMLEAIKELKAAADNQAEQIKALRKEVERLKAAR